MASLVSVKINPDNIANQEAYGSTDTSHCNTLTGMEYSDCAMEAYKTTPDFPSSALSDIEKKMPVIEKGLENTTDRYCELVLKSEMNNVKDTIDCFLRFNPYPRVDLTTHPRPN